MMAILLLAVPLVAAICIAAAPRKASRWIALAGSTLLLAIAVIAAAIFPAWGTADFGHLFEWEFLPQFGISLLLGCDSVAMMLILLNTVLMPLCVWGSFTAILDRQREYYAWLMILAAAANGVFLAKDLLLFYISFEFTLAPMFFLISLYGGANRDQAAMKFFLYTFTGSLVSLTGLLYVAWRFAAASGGWDFEIATLAPWAASNLDVREQGLVMLALLAGFAVKVPVFPVHTWLPLAHTEAPTAGSVMLAGVLLKLGTYGIYRFVLPMTPVAVVEYGPLVATLSVIGIIYAGLICWVQEDIKKLIAYSSVSHLGFCVLGLLSLNPVGAQGSILYMINHGFSTGALFLCVGMIYERLHTRDMGSMGGLAKRMPIWAFFMVFFTLSSLALPGLNGFVSEIYCVIGIFIAVPDATNGYPGVLGPWYAVGAGLGMIIAAMYLLIMVGKVVFGPERLPTGHGHEVHADAIRDLSPREIGVLAPLAVLCLLLGLQPKPFTDAMAGAVEGLLADYPDLVIQQTGGASVDAETATHAGELPVAIELFDGPADLNGLGAIAIEEDLRG